MKQTRHTNCSLWGVMNEHKFLVIPTINHKAAEVYKSHEHAQWNDALNIISSRRKSHLTKRNFYFKSAILFNKNDSLMKSVNDFVTNKRGKSTWIEEKSYFIRKKHFPILHTQ